MVTLQDTLTNPQLQGGLKICETVNFVFRMPNYNRKPPNKRPADHTHGMDTGEGDSEIPCHKREKFRQY